MKLTNDAKTYIHYLFTLNYKLALHVLAAVCEDDKQIDVNALMQIGQRMLARTEADAEYADFIAVNGDEQLRWARKHASHKHNVELTIARAIRIVLEKEKLGQAPMWICSFCSRPASSPPTRSRPRWSCPAPSPARSTCVVWLRPRVPRRLSKRLAVPFSLPSKVQRG